MTTGMKSSEFMLAVTTIVVVLAKDLIGWELPQDVIYTVIAYILGRSGVKIAEMRKEK